MSEEWDRREREDDAACDAEHGRICRACGKDYSREQIHHPCRCPVCGEDHREDHRGSDGIWVDFPDHDLVAKLLVP